MRERVFDVDVCETRVRTIQVTAANQENAHRVAEEQWALGLAPLDDTDVSDIHFTVRVPRRERPHER